MSHNPFVSVWIDPLNKDKQVTTVHDPRRRITDKSDDFTESDLVSLYNPNTQQIRSIHREAMKFTHTSHRRIFKHYLDMYRFMIEEGISHELSDIERVPVNGGEWIITWREE